MYFINHNQLILFVFVFSLEDRTRPSVTRWGVCRRFKKPAHTGPLRVSDARPHPTRSRGRGSAQPAFGGASFRWRDETSGPKAAGSRARAASVLLAVTEAKSTGGRGGLRGKPRLAREPGSREAAARQAERRGNFPPPSPRSPTAALLPRCGFEAESDRCTRRDGMWTDSRIPSPNVAPAKCLRDSHGDSYPRLFENPQGAGLSSGGRTSLWVL